MDHNQVLKAPLDPETVLRAQAKDEHDHKVAVLAELRASMSDDEVLEQFGVDLSQINAD